MDENKRGRAMEADKLDTLVKKYAKSIVNEIDYDIYKDYQLEPEYFEPIENLLKMFADEVR